MKTKLGPVNRGILIHTHLEAAFQRRNRLADLMEGVTYAHRDNPMDEIKYCALRMFHHANIALTVLENE